MKKVFHCAVVFCLTLLHNTPGFSQTASVQANNPAAKAIDLFYHSVNESSHLFNGTEYIMYDQHIKGTPYFMDNVTTGSVFYDGTWYQDVPMLYELTTNKLVIRQYNGGVLICLVNEKVGSFILSNHTFIHIVPDSGSSIISDGFYDRIYNGNVKAYSRRQTVLLENPTTYETNFKRDDKYYINRNNLWYPISSESDALRVFKDHKKEVTKYLRQNKIRYKKTPEYAIVKMAEYYDQITH